MNQKQAKKSRQAKQVLQQETDKLLKQIRQEKEFKATQVMLVYQDQLRALPWGKRFGYCWRLMWRNKGPVYRLLWLICSPVLLLAFLGLRKPAYTVFKYKLDSKLDKVKQRG